MENKKSFMGPQGLLFALFGVGGSIVLGLLVSNHSQLVHFQHFQNPKVHHPEISVSSLNIRNGVPIEQFSNGMVRAWQKEAKRKGYVQNVPKRFQGVTLNFAKLPPKEKAIALTFDDGPWQGNTAKILDILKKNNIKATFFVVGKALKEHPELGQKIVDEGHIIANHTWSHRYHFFSPQAAAFEIDQTSKLIENITGVKPTLFRPPGGILNNGLASYAKGQNQTVVLWSADSNDYKLPAVPKLVSNVMRDSKSGGIVLLHDGGGNRSRTVQALPQIISNFRKQGYRFVTVPELLEIEDKALAKKPVKQS